MILTRHAVNRPIATMMAVLAVLMGGLLSFFYLPVDLMPNVESKVITVFVGVRGGMPPQDIENLVTEPIEDAMSTMPGLETVLSVSRKDKSTITLNFNEKTDIQRSSLDVSERLARIRGKLPNEIEKPIVARYNEHDHPIVILTATSSVKTPEILRTMIERDLKPVLSRVPGVANVEIGGGRQRKILVEFEKSKLEAHRLSILDVIRDLGSNNVSLTSGRYETRRDEWGVQFIGDFKSLDEMKELGVAVTREGSRIRLKDIAVVRDYYLEPESYARVNSQPSVSIYIQKESGANTIRVAQEVMRLVGVYEKTLPGDVGLGVGVDQSVAILQSIADIRWALTWGAFLTALVLWFFLKSLKQVSVIVLSIPVAVMGTFFVMLVQSSFAARWGGMAPISINVMSLLGVALGIGRMVDDSIVVFENILRRNEVRRRRGEAFLKEDIVQATREMAVAVVSSTLVMVVIFLPIIMISEDIRRLYSDVAFTVIAALLASTVMAFTVVPLLAGRAMPGPGETLQDLHFKWERGFKSWMAEKWPRFETWLRSSFIRFGKRKSPHAENAGSLQTSASAADSTTGKQADGLPSRRRWTFAAAIQRGTAWSVRKRFWLLGGILVSLAFTGVIYKFGLKKEFMGAGEKREFVIFVELPAGTKLDVSDQVVTAVEGEINNMPEVKEVVKTVQSRVEGWSSKIYVTLTPTSQRTKSAQDVIDDLRPRLAPIGGEFEAFIYFSEPRADQEMVVDVFGPDYGVLRDVAVDIAKRLQEIETAGKLSVGRRAAARVAMDISKIPGLQKFGSGLATRLSVKAGLRDIKLRYKPGQPEVRLEVDHARASLFGLTSKDIADTMHAQIRGLRATYFNTGDDQVETVARLSEEDRRTMEQVSRLTTVANKERRPLVPIQQVINFRDGHTPSEVWRKDKERMIQVSANRERLALSVAVENIQGSLAGLEIPPGYRYEIGGDYKKLVKSEREFATAFLVMLVLIYIVLACFFESYTLPFLMLLSIPLATAGSIPALWLTGTKVNMGVYIGLLMLGGTVVANSIILIDRLNVTRARRGLYRSVLMVGVERARPIFMTSLTTIAAMLPLTLQVGESAELWMPLALTVTSGLAVSATLTLFIVPAAYVILDNLTTRR